MSTSLPESVNHRRLAEQKQDLQGTIELARFVRLSECIQGGADEVEASVRFRLGRGGNTRVTGTAVVEVQLQCQQCLDPMPFELRISTRSIVVASEEEAGELEEEEFIIPAGELIKLVDVFEDDLMLGLPMVSRHDYDCLSDAQSSAEEDEVQVDTYRPFAGLADLKDKILKQ